MGEAETVLANIEDEKAEIDAAKRAEAEQRRAEARQEAEQVESVQRTAEDMANTVTALAEGAKLTANTNQDTRRAGRGLGNRATFDRSRHRAIQLFREADPRCHYPSR